MSRRLSFTLVIASLALLIAVPVYALPGKPDFGEHIYVDGVAWGTKATAALPDPDGAEGSFDILFVFLDQYGNPIALEEQLLVGDAAPGDSDYNGGRWEVYTAQWNVEPDREFTSDTEVWDADGGDLTITKGSFAGGPPDYFDCPLLPVKE